MKKLLLIVAIALLTSCAGQHFTTQFAIKTNETVYYDTTIWFDHGEWKEATPQEVSDALIKQAIKLGYDAGRYIINLSNKKHKEIEFGEYYYSPEVNTLDVNGVVFF